MHRVKITHARTEAVAALTEADRAAMWALFERHYDSVSHAQFLADLAGKQHVIRMFDARGGLRGFSTIQLLHTEHDGRPILTLFSGDTVIDRACWGQKALQIEFARFLIRTRLANPRRRLYWFLISKGFKTYLLMRNNFTCWPNHERPTPPEARRLLDHVARLKFPGDYDAERGVIAFEQLHGAVKSELAHVGPAELQNPDIRFFVEKNPGWARGDELCCIAEVRLSQVARGALKYTLARPAAALARRVAGVAGSVVAAVATAARGAVGSAAAPAPSPAPTAPALVESRMR